MERYKLSELFKNQDLIYRLSHLDIIDIDMLESDFYLVRQGESFINHVGEKDALIKLLSDRALKLNCEIRQMHQINNEYMDCLAFIPLKDNHPFKENFDGIAANHVLDAEHVAFFGHPLKSK